MPGNMISGIVSYCHFGRLAPDPTASSAGCHNFPGFGSNR
jgi:hypothetical protein